MPAESTEVRPRETTAQIVKIAAEAPGIRRLYLAPAEPWPLVPGQVVTLGMGDDSDDYYAIASAPREGSLLCCLVKATEGTVRLLDTARVGDVVRLGGPFGCGFPLGPARGADLLLVGVGTAIAPLRSALVEVLARRGDVGRIDVVYGVRCPEQACFADDLAAWRAAGVGVTLVVSRPDEAPGWTGPTGWVQAHLTAVAGPRTYAMIAGMDAMELAVADALRALGVDPAAITTNVDPAAFESGPS